jgi:putative ABC transport system ATP-binding protein
VIELRDIVKVYNQGAANEFTALKGISLELSGGGVTCLQGPSGSGKTTLLSLIGCLSRPTSGRITLEGRILSGLPERFLADVRRRTFGFVFQRFHLVPGLSVRENIMLPAYPLAPPYQELVANTRRLLEQFGLASKEQMKIEHLSGGEAQRVAICRALINDPKILIADEPTANLDSALSRELMAIIGELQDTGRTILISSHDPLVFDAPIVDRVVTMRDGLIQDYAA